MDKRKKKKSKAWKKKHSEIMKQAFKEGRVVMPMSIKGYTHWRKGTGKDRVNEAGYKTICKPDYTTRTDGYILEHRYIMEKHLGRRLLKTEFLHHKNGDKQDNRIKNLEIMSVQNHGNEIKCPYCQQDFFLKQ